MMYNKIVMRIPSDQIEQIFLNGYGQIQYTTRPKIEGSFSAYIYCPKATEEVYDDSEGEHRLVYYADDLARIHEPYGDISIRNPYGSLGEKDRLLNGYIVGCVTVDRIEKVMHRYILHFSKVHWYAEPMRVQNVTDSIPLGWTYAKA